MNMASYTPLHCILVIGYKGNREFCFPETFKVPRGKAEGNIESLEETKLTVSRGARQSLGVLVYLPTQQ